MSGYVIIDVEVTDSELHTQFREQLNDVLPSYGGKHVVRGGQIDVVEGSWHPTHLVIMEYIMPCLANFPAWRAGEAGRSFTDDNPDDGAPFAQA